MDDERPPRLWWGMWKRFLIAGVLIVALSGAATATVALNKVSEHRRTRSSRSQPHQRAQGPDHAPNTAAARRRSWSSAPTAASDSKDSDEREDPPHSDTILLVRFDPEQGQTSVLSIPRDLLVNINDHATARSTPNEKINAAYTIGSQARRHRAAASVLAAETIKREVFPALKLNGIVDVNFAGFIKVVDTLGCAYVNVDHRYYNENVGSTGNRLHEHQPAARLPEAVLRKRARLRALPPHRLGLRARRAPAGLPARPARADRPRQRARPDRHGRQGGRTRDHARPSTASAERADRTREADRVLAGQAAAPGQVPDARNVNCQSQRRLVRDLDAGTRAGRRSTNFLDGHEQLQPAGAPSRSAARTATATTPSPRARRLAGALDLFPTSSAARAKWSRPALGVPFRVLYPRYRPARPNQQMVRPYALTTSTATCTTPTSSSGSRTRSAATTTSRAPTG